MASKNNESTVTLRLRRRWPTYTLSTLLMGISFTTPSPTQHQFLYNLLTFFSLRIRRRASVSSKWRDTKNEQKVNWCCETFFFAPCSSIKINSLPEAATPSARCFSRNIQGALFHTHTHTLFICSCEAVLKVTRSNL